MTTPFWTNPCNAQKEDLAAVDQLNLDVKCPEAELAINILNQANAALTSAYEIKNQFISTIFRMEYDRAEEMYKECRLSFLPTQEEIPKTAGQCLSLTKLKDIKLSTVLPVLYTSLQKIAVGVEMLSKNNSYSRFKSVELHLRNVLCEFYTAFKEMKLEMPRDVRRNVVPKFYRNMRLASDAKIRDYVIFREYINTLEYTVTVFNNILQKYPTISFFQSVPD